MQKIKKISAMLLAVLMVIFMAIGTAGCEPEKNTNLTYTASALATATVGVEYSASVATAKGEDAVITYALKAGSVLPAGLSLDSAGSGVITGTPTAATSGAASFTVVASAEGYTGAEATFSLTVSPGTFTYSGATLASGKVGVAYSSSVATATGAVGVSYTLKTGSTLPGGLTLNSSGNGTISGTPNRATNGAHSFTVVAKANGYADEEETFNVTISTGEISYDSTSLSGGNLGVAYSASVAVATAQGTLSPTITYALKAGNNLPAGLTLNASGSGAITGTPTASGTYTFTIVASAFEFADEEATFTIIIANAGELAYSGSSLIATVGMLYSSSIATATGAPSVSYALKAGSTLPAWLILNNGTLSGTPSATAASYSFTVVASASGYTSAEANFSITVRAGNITFTNATLISAVKGESYSAKISATAAGASVISYSIQSGSNAPAGLTLAADGTLSGTPTAILSGFTFVVIASAANYNSATATFTITVMDKLKTFDFWTVYTDLSNFVGDSWVYMSGYPDYTTIERTGIGNSDKPSWDTQGHIADYFLQGVHNTENQELVWRIMSDSATTAILQMSMALEIVKSNVEMYSSTEVDVYGGRHRIVVNNSDVAFGKYTEFDAITLSRASEAVPMQFKLYTMARITLVEGENIIKFMIGTNDWLENVAGAWAVNGSAPSIELIRLNTTANLSWTPKLSNITNRAALQDNF